MGDNLDNMTEKADKQQQDDEVLYPKKYLPPNVKSDNISEGGL